MSKKIGIWGKSLGIRLDRECNVLDIKDGDAVDVRIKNGVIEIRKIETEYHVVNGDKFVVKG